MFRIFGRILDYLLPLRLYDGKLILRLYEHPSNRIEERLAFTSVAVCKFRFVGSEIHVERLSVDISPSQKLPTITRATVALEEFPDLEAETELFEDINDLIGPMTLHMVGVGDEPLVVIAH